MNQDNDLSRDHASALADLIEAQRVSQSAADQMDEAFAELLGVNRTDARCLDIVHLRRAVSAGELGREAGLTSGAVTAALDRMEKAGYLARQADPADRRRVVVVTTPELEALAEAVYGQVGRIGARNIAAMPVAQMDLVARFLRTGAWINQQLAARLRATVSAGPGDPATVAQAFARQIEREAETLDRGLAAAWARGGTSGGEPSGG